MIDLENKQRTQFECAHEIMKDNEDDTIENKGLEIVLKHYKKRKKKEISA